jgi:hypothetical protein
MHQNVVATTNEGRDYVQPGGGEGGCHVRLWLRLDNRAGMTYTLVVESQGDASNCGCDYKTRAGKTYRLEVEREDHMSL